MVVEGCLRLNCLRLAASLAFLLAACLTCLCLAVSLTCLTCLRGGPEMTSFNFQRF